MGERPDESLPVTPPKEITQTLSVAVPMKTRLHKDKLQIVNMESNSTLIGRAHVGDRIIRIDGEPVTSCAEVTAKAQKAKEAEKRLSMMLLHTTWSWSVLKSTTVEHIMVDKDTDKTTGRAIAIYYILIRVSRDHASDLNPVGIFVKYDARERLMVCGVDPKSVTAVHLRAGDIIREVNNMPVASKTMLNYHILNSLHKNGTFSLVVESSVCGSDVYREMVEMAPDVVDTAAKHVEKIKNNQLPKVKDCFTKKKGNKNVKIAKEERTVDLIHADCDITKLRPVKGSKG